MQRHAKKLQKKSRTHQIEESGDSWLVTSGTSGETYRVVELTTGSFNCTCNWHIYHPAGECSHTASVRDHIAQQEGRRVILHSTVEDFRKSHRKYEDFNEGVIVSTRKG